MKEHSGLLSQHDLPNELPENYSIQQLTGDASARSYFRITIPSGEKLILMRMSEPFDETNFPYLHNYHLFRSAGVPLAEIYFMAPSRGFVFLQDLGDATFYELYHPWNQQTRLSYYLKALECLRCIEKIRPAGTLAFDTEKLLWELEFFQEHFLGGLREVRFSQDESDALHQEFLRLAKELAEQPRIFCHRDYHSRNLMVHSNQFYVLDFQDARLGPTTYDLASLCYDSYVQHSGEFLTHLEKVFFIYHPDAHLQRYEYPRMCLQRNLKALGTFGYQTSRLGREFYLQFVKPTLLYVKQHFDKLPEYVELRRLLSRHLPELDV